MIIIFKNRKKLSLGAEKTITLMSRGLKRNGIKSKIVNLEDVEIFLEKGLIKAIAGKKSVLACKMIYFRKVGTYRNVAFIISNLAKNKNIFFMDDFHAGVSTRGKLIQMFLLAMQGLPIPKTYHSLVYDDKRLRRAVSFLEYPIVVKATNLGGGRMIYLAKNKGALKKILKKHPDTEFIFQKFIKNNFDYRVVVLGGKALVAEKRIRVNEKEFRNNACRGGKEIFIDIKDVPQNIKSLAVKAAKVMDVQVAGVDIVRSLTGKDYIFEVNPAPGFSIDDKTSNELSETVKYLVRCAKKTS